MDESVMRDAPFRLEVGTLPPAPETPPEGADDPASGPADPATIGTVASDGWTDDDMLTLVEWVKGPYELVALQAGGYWALSDREAKAIAVPMAGIIPVSWVRDQRRSPLVSGVSLIVALVMVNRPRLARMRAEREAADVDRSREAARGPGGDDGSGDRVDRAAERRSSGESARPDAARRFAPIDLSDFGPRR